MQFEAVLFYQGVGEGVEPEENYNLCNNTSWVNYTTDFLIAEQVGRESIIFCLTIHHLHHHPPYRRAAGTVGCTDTSDSLHLGLSDRYRKSEFEIDYIDILKYSKSNYIA